MFIYATHKKKTMLKGGLYLIICFLVSECMIVENLFALTIQAT